MSHLQQQSQIMTDDILWHYTDLKAAQSIFESRELRLTNVWTYRCRPETKADWQEFSHGLDIYSKNQHGQPADRVRPKLDEITKLYSPFVMCFSKSDANNTLWKDRAGQDGVCLGFSRRKFFEVFPKSKTFKTNNGTLTYDLSLEDCIYDPDKKRAQMTGDSTDLQVGFAEDGLDFLLKVLFKAVFLKRECFSSEKEVRLALAPSQFPAGNIPGLTYRPYHSLSADRGNLPIVAVTTTSENTRGKIASLLKKMDYSNVDIRLRSVT